jgi:GNAT superfamily N-acetyltransferase
MTLRHALRRDLPAIVQTWVDAFADDPFLRWIQPDDDGWSEFGSAWMATVADLLFERGHLYVTDPSDVAVGWVPPDVALVTPDVVERVHSLVAQHAGEARAEAALGTIVAARAEAEDDSHWTLQYLGVRPDRQGRGLGAIAVAPMLEVCDAESVACALVSTNARNVPFYERVGFTVAAEVATPDGVAVLRPMRRQARLPPTGR